MEKFQDEEWIVVQIAEPEAAGFHDQSEEPFQAEALHPVGCLADCAGQEIKRGTDRGDHGRVYATCSGIDP